jgi:hypothetical protein
VQLLIGVVVDVHLCASFKLVHLALNVLILVLNRLVVKSRVNLVGLVGIQPRVLFQQPINEPFQLVYFLFEVLSPSLQRSNL